MSAGCDVLSVTRCAIRPEAIIPLNDSRTDGKKSGVVQKLPVLNDFLWQSIFTFVEPSKSIPQVNRSFRRNYTEMIRPKVEGLLNSESWSTIAKILPSFTTMSLPKKKSRLSPSDLVATYHQLYAVAKRVLECFSVVEKESFEGKSPRIIIDDSKMFLELLVSAKMYAIGAFFKGSSGSLVERGRLCEKLLTSGNAPLPTAMILSDKKLSCLPPEIGAIPSIKVLDVSLNRLFVLPSWIEKLTTLTHLNLSGNDFRHLPEGLGSLSALTMIDISRNPLHVFPSWLGNIRHLEVLTIDSKQAKTFSKEVKLFRKDHKSCRLEIS